MVPLSWGETAEPQEAEACYCTGQGPSRRSYVERSKNPRWGPLKSQLHADQRGSVGDTPWGQKKTLFFFRRKNHLKGF